MPRATPTPQRLARLGNGYPVKRRALEAWPKPEVLGGTGQSGNIRVINIEHSITSLLLAL